MNEQLAKQLIRQLKLINFWIGTAMVLMIAGLIVLGLILFQLIHFVQGTTDKITTFTQTTQQNIDIRNKLCSSSGTLGSLIKNQTDICD